VSRMPQCRQTIASLEEVNEVHQWLFFKEGLRLVHVSLLWTILAYVYIFWLLLCEKLFYGASIVIVYSFPASTWYSFWLLSKEMHCYFCQFHLCVCLVLRRS